jgi:hypothetical protein
VGRPKKKYKHGRHASCGKRQLEALQADHDNL